MDHCACVFVSSVSEIKVYIYRSLVGPKRAQQLRFVVQPLMAVGFYFILHIIVYVYVTTLLFETRAYPGNPTSTYI